MSSIEQKPFTGDPQVDGDLRDLLACLRLMGISFVSPAALVAWTAVSRREATVGDVAHAAWCASRQLGHLHGDTAVDSTERYMRGVVREQYRRLDRGAMW